MRLLPADCLMFNERPIFKLFIEHQTAGTRRRREKSRTIINPEQTSERYIILKYHSDE